MKTVYQVELNEEFSVSYMTQDMSTAELHSPFFIKFGEDSVTCFSSAKPKPTPIIVSRSDSEVETEIDSEIEKKFEFSLNSIVSDTLMNNIKNCEKLKAQ